MYPNRKISSNQYLLDKAGMWTSAICAVHCLMLPALISLTAIGELAFLQHTALENTILIISVLIGMGALIPSYVRRHRNLVPVVIFFSGFILIGLSRFRVNESVLVSSGAALVASAHLFNFRLCKKWNNNA